MKRSIFATLIALLMSVGSAYALTLDELRSAIQLCNLECPQQVEDGLSIQSYKMDNDNIYITYLVTDDELFACIKIIKDRAAEIMAEGLVGEKDMQYILSSCVEHHINFVFKFTDKSNTDTLSCLVPYNKIAEMLGTPSTSSSTSTSSRTELDLLISTMQSELPIVLDETITFQSISANSQQVRLEIVVDSNTYELMCSNPSLGRSSLKEAFTQNEDMQILFRYCRDLNLNFTFCFVKRNNKDKYDFTYTPSEL